jgi:hypothetical protein
VKISRVKFILDGGCVSACQIVQHQNISVNSVVKIIHEFFPLREVVGWMTSCMNSASGFSDAHVWKLHCLELSDVSDCGLNSYRRVIQNVKIEK